MKNNTKNRNIKEVICKFYKHNSKKIEKVFFVFSIMLFGTLVYVDPAFATAPTGAGATTVTNGISSLTDIVKAFVSAVGAIIVLWGLFEWGNAMQTNDGGMQSAAFKRIGGGIIMTLGPQIFLSLIA
jgi:hypothetical protein